MIWVYLALLALGFLFFAIFLVASIAISERDDEPLFERWKALIPPRSDEEQIQEKNYTRRRTMDLVNDSRTAATNESQS